MSPRRGQEVSNKNGKDLNNRHPHKFHAFGDQQITKRITNKLKNHWRTGLIYALS